MCNHWTCSKSFSGKKGMKLSHGKFWPSHEKIFSKRVVNLMVEWVTAHGQSWKSHQLNYSKLNWTIKNVWSRQTSLQSSAKETPCPWLNFSFVFSGQIYTENYLVPQIMRMMGPDYFSTEDFHFTCLQGQIHWMATKLKILLLWQAWHLLVEGWKIKFLCEFKPWISQFIEKYGTV